MKETQPEPEQEVQPEQPEQQQLPRDDSTPRQFFRAFGFSEAQPGPQSSGFGVKSPPPSYAQGPEQQMEPWHPSERADQQPERVSWLDAAPPIEPQPAAKQGAGDKDADGKADEDEQEERMKVPSGSGKQTKTRRGQNKSQKEIAEQQRKQTNGKKAETWAEIMSNSGSRRSKSEASSGEDSDSDGKGSSKSKIVKRFIRRMAKAVQDDMEQTLAMAPGGELNEKSIEFVKQSAQAVIQQQCEYLYDPKKHVHRDICYEIVNRVRKLTSKFEQDLDWDGFSDELGDLMDKAVDALRRDNWRILSSNSSDSSSSKSSKQKQKRKAPAEPKHQPAGPDERAFGAG